MKDLTYTDTPVSSTGSLTEVPAGIFDDDLSDNFKDSTPHSPANPVETIETIAEVMTLQDEWTDVEHNYSDEGLLSMDSQAVEFRKLITQPICIVITGTSGAGKSTIADQVASIFGAKLISTDFMRHELRQLVSKKQAKFLHCSTYNTWEVFSEAERKKTPQETLALRGYKKQARLICGKNCKNLKAMIDKSFDGESVVVVEGVHLHPKLMKELSKSTTYPVIPFVIQTKSPEAHYERLSFRASSMGLDAKNNKYCKNFKNIRAISDYMGSIAKLNHIPVVNNTSLSCSVNSVTECVLTISMRYFVTISQKKSRFAFKPKTSKGRKIFGKSAYAALDCFVDRNADGGEVYDQPDTIHNPVINKPTFTHTSSSVPMTRSPVATVEIDIADLNMNIPVVVEEFENTGTSSILMFGSSVTSA